MQIKSCPFCKSNRFKLMLNRYICGYNGLDWPIERHIWYVRCNQCKARGSVASGRVIPDYYKSEIKTTAPWETTDETLKRIAIELWNCRVNEIDAAIPVEFLTEEEKKTLQYPDKGKKQANKYRKEEPIKKKYDDYTGQISDHCPKCDTFIERYNPRIPWQEIKYCSYCGQAVRWK